MVIIVVMSNLREKVDNLTKDLRVEEKCAICGNWVGNYCNTCFGKGKILRELTDEEMVKIFNACKAILFSGSWDSLTLSSGARVVRVK